MRVSYVAWGSIAGMLVVGGLVYGLTPPRQVRSPIDAGPPPQTPLNVPRPSDSAQVSPEITPCCRTGAEALCAAARELAFSDKRACNPCQAGEKQVLDPQSEWSLWLQSPKDEPSFVPCAQLGGHEVCAGNSLGTQQSHGLRVKLEDIQQKRLRIKLIAPPGTDTSDQEGVARIEGDRGSNALLSTALCEGVKLYVAVPDDGGSRDARVKVYLVKPKDDDIR